jgi:hypothetical protein
LQTFPRVETWYGKLGDFLMVAGDFEYTAARITEKLAIPVYAEALRIGWKTDSREGFFSHHLGDHDFSLQVAKPTEGHPNTDDKTYIEFAMARTITQDLEAGNTITRDAYNSNAYKPKMTDHATLDENKLRQEFLATLIFEGQEIRNIEALLNPQLHLFSERMELLKSYRDLDFKPVFDRWPVADPATLTYREKIIQLGDLAFAREPQFFAALDQSDPQIKLLSPFFQSIFHGSDQNVEKTGTYLKTAFIHLRTDPWVDPGLIQIALRLAIWVANEDPAPARELYEILSAPFAADVAQKDRIATRWQIAQIIGLQEFCPELLAPWPRYSPWPGFDQLRHACALAEGA